jgi:DNA polymerase III alpha subunit
MAMIRTGYSFKTAFGHLEQVASRIKEIGWEVAPITDRDSTFGFVRWAKICSKLGLRPVFGVELMVTPLDPWTFLARDSLRPLHDLINLATSNPGKQPSLTYEQAQNNDLIRITGPAPRLDRLNNLVTDQVTYVGLSPASPIGMLRQAKAMGLPLCALQDNYYPREEDFELFRVVVRNGSSQTYPMHIQAEEAFRGSLSRVPREWVDEGLENQRALLAASLAGLPRAELLRPEKPVDLRTLCLEGARRTGTDLTDPVYAERLERELALIAEKKFEDYFHIVADMMMWARERMVVGPARGSSCGSLVCYLLGITSIDPIPFGLIFERFIDTTRADLPDIDLDFSDAKRHLVFEYMDRKYGADRSARLGSVNMLKAKACLNLAGASLRIPSGAIEELATTVIKRSMGDSRASSTIEDTFTDTDTGRKFIEKFPEAMITTRMENHPANAAQHAAGVVLTDRPVSEYVAIDARTGGTMCDKKDAEEFNLLKIDALGLTQLSIFERTMELIGVEPKSSWLEALPLDDQAAFDVLNKCKFAGIFQFMVGTASARLIVQLVENFGGRMDSIEDIVALTAIVRPGPLGSGAAEEWLKRRAGKSPVKYPHPSLEPYLKDTLGIIIYQEQVMNIGRNIGGLNWDDVTALRKAMSRSLGKEFFDQYGDRWKEGAKRDHGLPVAVADKMWEDLCTFGMWAFNRSHSVAYGVISYWCCWLKAHHPLEFAAATLDAQGDTMQQLSVLRELAEEGIEYVPFDKDRSTDRWTIADGKLIGPLVNVKGIGPKVMKTVLDSRKTGRPLPPGVVKKLEKGKTPIDSLTPIMDLAERKGLRDPERLYVQSPITKVSSLKGGEKSIVVVCCLKRIAPLNENELSRVAKRNGVRYSGPTNSVNLFVLDDTGEVFCKIGRYDYDRLAPLVIGKAREGKSVYVIKGSVPPDFMMIKVENMRYVGELDEDFETDLGSLAPVRGHRIVGSGEGGDDLRGVPDGEGGVASVGQASAG